MFWGLTWAELELKLKLKLKLGLQPELGRWSLRIITIVRNLLTTTILTAAPTNTNGDGICDCEYSRGITEAGSWESDSLRIAAFHISQTARTWNDINYVAINYRTDDRGQKRLRQQFKLGFTRGEFWRGLGSPSPSPDLFAIDQPQWQELWAAVQVQPTLKLSPAASL